MYCLRVKRRVVGIEWLGLSKPNVRGNEYASGPGHADARARGLQTTTQTVINGAQPRKDHNNTQYTHNLCEVPTEYCGDRELRTGDRDGDA